VFLGKTGQNQHRQVRRARLDRRERVDAALVGHRQVHDEDVDLPLPDDVDGLATVRSLRDDLQVDLLGEELLQAGANDGVVVDDGDSDHGGDLGKARTWRGDASLGARAGR